MIDQNKVKHLPNYSLVQYKFHIHQIEMKTAKWSFLIVWEYTLRSYSPKKICLRNDGIKWKKVPKFWTYTGLILTATKNKIFALEHCRAGKMNFDVFRYLKTWFNFIPLVIHKYRLFKVINGDDSSPMNGHPRSLYANNCTKIMTSTSQDLFQVLTISKDWHNLWSQLWHPSGQPSLHGQALK